MAKMRKLYATLTGALTVLSLADAASAQTPAGSTARPSARSDDPAPAAFAPEFLGQFNSSMSKFIALAEAMPAEKFAWSPGPGVMSVAKVYAHVAHYNYRYPSKNMEIGRAHV